MVSNNSSSLHLILPSEFALGNRVSHTRFPYSLRNRVSHTQFSQSKIESSGLDLLEMKFVSNLA